MSCIRSAVLTMAPAGSTKLCSCNSTWQTRYSKDRGCLAQVATLKQELQDAKADCQRANQGHAYGDVIQSLRTELRSQEADVEKARNLLHRAE